MAKKHQNNKPHQNACEKLKKAVNFSPFGRFYRVSNHQQNHPIPTPPPSNNPIKAYFPPSSFEQLIPIDTPAHSNGQLIVPKVNRAQAMFIAKQKRTHDINNGGVQVDNERFSEHITRVRHDMRTSSDLGVERIPTKKISRRDSINDRVAKFLHRTKIKNRITSHVGHDMHGNGKDY